MWVPVSETDKLPQLFAGVNVYCPKNDNVYCAYLNARGEWYTFDPSVAGIKITEEVSHWRPLPKKPGTEEMTNDFYKNWYDTLYRTVTMSIGEERFKIARNEVLSAGNQSINAMVAIAIEKLRDDAGDFDQ